jgi:hypothetical protein
MFVTHSVQGNPLLCGWSTKRECPGDPPLPLTADVKNTTQSKPFVLLLLTLYNIVFSHSTNTHKPTLPILSFGVSSASHDSSITQLCMHMER